MTGESKVYVNGELLGEAKDISVEVTQYLGDSIMPFSPTTISFAQFDKIMTNWGLVKYSWIKSQKWGRRRRSKRTRIFLHKCKKGISNKSLKKLGINTKFTGKKAVKM